VMKWARGRAFPWNAVVYSGAASGGHLELIKWVRENGCPWNANTCSNAASGGHLEVIKWVRENGCPWDERHVLVLRQHSWTKLSSIETAIPRDSFVHECCNSWIIYYIRHNN